MPLRVLHVSQPTTEGTARVVAQLTEAGIRDGQEVSAACSAHGVLAGEVIALGATWHDVAMRRLPSVHDLRQLFALRRLARRTDVLVLHSSKAGLLGRMALLSIRRGERPVSVFVPHGWSWHAAGRLNRTMRGIERLLAGVTDSIVAVSQVELAEGRAKLGHHADSLHLIPNGVDTRHFRPPEVPRDSTTVVTVGRLSRQKGQDLLIGAMPMLPTVQLTLIGDGPERAALEGLAERLGVAQRVTFTGAADPLAALQSAAVVVLPSRWEGLSLALLEAMATAAPIIATPAGAGGILDDAGWVVAGDEAHLPAKLAEAIQGALQDPSARASFGARANARVTAQFSIDATAANHLDHWKSLRGSARER